MSFSDTELDAHCNEIITDPAIRNRIVILCEGDSKPFKKKETETKIERAHSIKELAEKTQDSAFYYRAIPTWWKETKKYEPVFRICGTQANVIKAYFKLLKIHQNNPLTSYLKPNRLFAFIDIDLQKLKLPNSYHFKNLEEIYCDLYLNGKVNPDTAKNHKIWVTGLLHKESYFLIPELEIKNLFDNYQHAPLFYNQNLHFESIYRKIFETMPNHSDIENNFEKQ